MYSEKTINHFLNPIYSGELSDADSVGEAGSPLTGIFLKIWIKLDKGVISKAAFKAAGCVPIIAACNVTSGMVCGLKPEEALQIKISSVIRELGGIPAEKKYTVKLALDALKEAIINLKK